MAVLEVNLGATSSRTFRMSSSAVTNWSHQPTNASRTVAPLTSQAQAYYWTHAWQTDEAETLASLAEGNGHVFTDAQAAIRWLLSSDD